MDGEKVRSMHNSQNSVWDTVVEYGKEQSMVVGANKNMYSLVGEEDPLSIIRKKHIDWLRGEYKPTSEDFDLFEEDEDFYNSDLYVQYRKEEVLEFSKQHHEIYNPSEKEVQKGVLPFMDIIRRNKDKLLKVGSEFEVNRVSGIKVAVEFFSRCFGVEDVPRIEIVDDEYSSDGSYGHHNNTLTVNIGMIGFQTSNILNTIAHEVWHAHQYVCGDVRYEDNFNHYFKPSMDTSGYVNQLVEKEAFMVGKEVRRLYNNLRAPIIFARMMDDTEEIEKWNRRFDEWVDDYKFNPPDSDEDDAWIKMAVARMRRSGISLDDFSEEDPFEAVRYCVNEEFKETNSALAYDYPPLKTNSALAYDYPPLRAPKMSFLKRLFKNRKGAKK